MRWKLNPIFDEFGVDLVLGGHSHVYERSYLLQGHYGQSSELDSEHMILDSSNGTPSTNAEEDNTYRKTAGFSQPNSGTIYVVAGSAAKIANESSEHFYKLNNPGMAYVFISERDGPLADRTIRHIVLRAGQEANLSFPAHPQMLRHACGFYLANKGVDTRSIQHYLGHRNIQHTVRYTELVSHRFDDFWDD